MIINVNGQLLTVADRNLLVSGSVNIYGAVVNFSPEWDGFEKVIVWKRVGAAITEPIIRPIVNGVGSIPNEIVSDPGRIRVGVAGVTATKRMPTVWSEVFEVVPGAYPGAFIPEPDPDIWQQFAEILEEVRREAAETIQTAGEVMQSATNAAQASADKASEASQSASNAAGSAQSAAESATSASESKDAASQSASDAELAKTSAESAKNLAENAKNLAESYKEDADEAASSAEQSATSAANTLASINTQANARKAEINELASAQKTQITDLTESKKAEIQSKGDAVLASIPEDYTEVLSDIGELKQDIITKADKSEVDALRIALAENKRVDDSRWAISEGIVWAEESDSVEAYSKTIPSGAKMADVQMIGGTSIVWNQLAELLPPYSFSGGSFLLPSGYQRLTKEFEVKKGHTYLFLLKADATQSAKSFQFYTVGGLSYNYVSTTVKRIEADAIIRVQSAKYASDLDINVEKLYVFDLTLMGYGDITSVDDPRIAMIEAYAEAHPEYNAGEVIHADVDRVEVRGANAEITPQLLPIPEAIRQLPCYGASVDGAHNEVDYENKKYIQRIGVKDLGDIGFTFIKANQYVPVDFFRSEDFPEIAVTSTTGMTLCAEYIAAGRSDVIDKSYSKWNTANERYFVFKDSRFSNVSDFKNAVKGIKFYFTYAEPIITDISDLLDNRFEDLDVEAGGSITFHQSDDSKHLPVPNVVDYTVKLSEVV